MGADDRELAAMILGFLRNELALDVAELGEHSALVTTGILDSAGLVRLAALLERRLRIRIPDRDINAENFDTIRRIQTYVKHRAPG